MTSRESNDKCPKERFTLLHGYSPWFYTLIHLCDIANSGYMINIAHLILSVYLSSICVKMNDSIAVFYQLFHAKRPYCCSVVPRQRALLL